jgi:hypothetical protein
MMTRVLKGPKEGLVQLGHSPRIHCIRRPSLLCIYDSVADGRLT